MTLGDPKSRGALRRSLDRDLDGRVARRIREALRDLGDAGSTERKRVSDDVESLKNELQELQLRLAKLEQKKKKKVEHADAQPEEAAAEAPAIAEEPEAPPVAVPKKKRARRTTAPSSTRTKKRVVKRRKA